MNNVVGGFIGLLGLVATAASQSLNVSSPAQAWNLVWSDEFDSTSINGSNWTYDTGGGGWGNGELENYTNRAANASLQNGALLIVARKESYGGSSYTSARLKSQNLRSFTYGRIEARLRLPAAQGLWPAFWMLGSSINQVGWPKCGEIDVMEHINTVPLVQGTMHWDYNGHVSSGGSTSCDVTQYHVYSIEWNSGAITWFVDGSQYWQGSIANNINGTDEFHAPFFIILNLAVGGSWPGNPDATTPFPDTVYVDYVRVYQLATNVGRDLQGQTPDQCVLLQNYPNPFNPTTTIDFTLPSAGFVSLKVYDLLGREVMTLLNEQKAAGTYRATFDATNLPSGTYFYVLRAGSFNDVKKMTLVK